MGLELGMCPLPGRVGSGKIKVGWALAKQFPRKTGFLKRRIEYSGCISK